MHIERKEKGYYGPLSHGMPNTLGVRHLRKHILVLEPSGLRISIDEQTTILDAIRMVGLHVPSECGGRGTCKKCRVTLNPAPTPTPGEVKLLQKQDIDKGVRFACQHRISSDVRAVLSHSSATVKILIKGVSSTGDFIPDEGHQGEYGIAVDLGTTTIVVYLLDLGNGNQIANLADLNPQVIFGEDVMSRIAYAMKDEKGKTLLKRRVLEKIDELGILLCSTSEVPSDNLSRLVVVGNTAMHHLALGLDPSSLGLAPYEPQMRDAFISNGRKIGLKSAPEAEVYFAPNVAGFVGGDTLAFILSQRLDLVDDIVLGIDIGTNGEIVLSRRGELFCCSAAAGSAFEGATISHGMRGQDGAIEHLAIREIDDAPEISVIGGGVPKGLCGSAIVDTVAELLRNGLIDAGGRMKTSARVVDDTKAGLAYLVANTGENASKSRIMFTQRDVRQVQLAKGAILAGTQILMQVANVSTEDIKAIYLAGAFGNYIDPSSALRIGLFPPVDLERIIPVGNAAGEGAKRLLVSRKSRELIEQLRREVNYYELATHDNFADIFARATILESVRD